MSGPASQAPRARNPAHALIVLHANHPNLRCAQERGTKKTGSLFLIFSFAAANFSTASSAVLQLPSAHCLPSSLTMTWGWYLPLFVFLMVPLSPTRFSAARSFFLVVAAIPFAKEEGPAALLSGRGRGKGVRF